MDKILSIIPAPIGWVARFGQGELAYVTAVAFWALVEDGDGNTRVTGFSEPSGGEFVPDDKSTEFHDWEFIGPGGLAKHGFSMEIQKTAETED